MRATEEWQAANTIQVRLLRDAKQPKKLKGEDWKTWNQRTLRAARRECQGGGAVVHVHTGADLETPWTYCAQPNKLAIPTVEGPGMVGAGEEEPARRETFQTL